MYMKAAVHILQDYTYHVPFIKNISQEYVSINRTILANVWQWEMWQYTELFFWFVDHFS